MPGSQHSTDYYLTFLGHRIHQNYVLIFITLISLGIQWYARSGGLMWTTDSRHYIAGSQSLRDTGTLIDDDGNPYLFWTPLFPLLLSLFKTPMEAIKWINILCTIFIALQVIKIGNRNIKDCRIRLFYCTFVLLGTHLLLIAVFLWSELIFLLLALSFYNQLLTTKDNGKSKTYNLTLALGFLLCLQRNAGLFIVTGAFLWLISQESRPQKYLLKFFFYFMITISGQICWNIYTWIVKAHGHFNFEESFFQYLAPNLKAYAHSLINVFLPIRSLEWLFLLILMIIIIRISSKRIHRIKAIDLSSYLAVSYILLFGIFLSINVAGFPFGFEEGDRFISVIIPFYSLILFKGLDQLVLKVQTRSRKLFIIVIALWLIYPLTRTFINAHRWHERSESMQYTVIKK